MGVEEMSGPMQLAPWYDPLMLSWDPFYTGLIGVVGVTPTIVFSTMLRYPLVRWPHNKYDLGATISTSIVFCSLAGSSIFSSMVRPDLRQAWLSGMERKVIAEAGMERNLEVEYEPVKRTCWLLGTTSTSSSCLLHLYVEGTGLVAIVDQDEQVHIPSYGPTKCSTMEGREFYKPYGPGAVEPQNFTCFISTAAAEFARPYYTSQWRLCPDRAPWFLRDPETEVTRDPTGMNGALVVPPPESTHELIAYWGKSWNCPATASSCLGFVLDDDANPSALGRWARFSASTSTNAVPSSSSVVRVAVSGVTDSSNIEDYPRFPSKDSVTADRFFMSGFLASAALPSPTTISDDDYYDDYYDDYDDYMDEYDSEVGFTWFIFGIIIANLAIFMVLPFFVRFCIRKTFLCDELTHTEANALHEDNPFPVDETPTDTSAQPSSDSNQNIVETNPINPALAASALLTLHESQRETNKPQVDYSRGSSVPVPPSYPGASLPPPSFPGPSVPSYPGAPPLPPPPARRHSSVIDVARMLFTGRRHSDMLSQQDVQDDDFSDTDSSDGEDEEQPSTKPDTPYGSKGFVL